MPEILSEELTIGTQANARKKIVYEIDPLQDERWDGLLERHASASVFHSKEWLEALRRTYGYESIAYTTSAPAEPLRNALVFCRTASWLTGPRLVSLPFSDHCEPLLEQPGDWEAFAQKLRDESETGQWRYIEMRPLESLGMLTSLSHPSARYTLHRLSLEPDLKTIFSGFHKDSIQRKIKRAKREGLTCQVGTTEPILEAFYRLLTITRRRHGVPPQPKAWFRNLIDCFGPALQISVALKGQIPVAGMITLRHKRTLVYKYGGSDARYNNLGSIHSLYWEAIQQAKALGLEEFDLGRSDSDQSGLIRFKSRWGATVSSLTYLRLAPSSNARHWFEPMGASWKSRAAQYFIAHVPARVLPAIGSLLYKHIG
jgi:CelD/BcsL family acetyltransferase involved in cellulose biosynthesis